MAEIRNAVSHCHCPASHPVRKSGTASHQLDQITSIFVFGGVHTCLSTCNALARSSKRPGTWKRTNRVIKNWFNEAPRPESLRAMYMDAMAEIIVIPGTRLVIAHGPAFVACWDIRTSSCVGRLVVDRHVSVELGALEEYGTVIIGAYILDVLYKFGLPSHGDLHRLHRSYSRIYIGARDSHFWLPDPFSQGLPGHCRPRHTGEESVIENILPEHSPTPTPEGITTNEKLFPGGSHCGRRHHHCGAECWAVYRRMQARSENGGLTFGDVSSFFVEPAPSNVVPEASGIYALLGGSGTPLRLLRFGTGGSPILQELKIPGKTLYVNAGQVALDNHVGLVLSLRGYETLRIISYA
ncbi:hypothetical protein DFH09DRAFT_1475397 [Mycena vulgaris]|nr:hypothetical protein DFH09DRAFT_1475397 [Mycena vulgaris]